MEKNTDVKYKLVDEIHSTQVYKIADHDEHQLKSQLEDSPSTDDGNLKKVHHSGNKGRKIVLGLLMVVVLLVGIITVVCLTCHKTKEDENSLPQADMFSRDQQPICEHSLCSLKTSSLLKYSKFSVDPCEDFYEFSCGNFILNRIKEEEEEEDEEDWTPLIRLGKWASTQMRRMLEDKNDIKSSRSSAIEKAARYHRTCLKNFDLTSSMKNLHDNFVEFFKSITPWSNNSTAKTWTLEEVIAFIGANEINPIVNVDQIYDTTLKRNVVSLDEGDLTYKGSKEHVKEKYEIHKDAFVDNLHRAAEMLGRPNDLAEEVWDLEKSLFEISYNSSHSLPFVNNSGLFTVAKVQEMLGDLLNISSLLRESLNRDFDDNEEIFLKNVNYFVKLPTVMSSLPKRSLTNFATWLLLHGISKFLPAEFSKHVSFVITDRLPAIRHCLASTMEIFEFATGALYTLNRKVSPEEELVIANIFVELREAFENLVDTREWLDEGEVKEKVKDKLKKLEYKIALKEADIKVAKMDEYYEKMDSTRSAIENFLFNREKRLHVPLDWLVNPVETFAKYNHETNEVDIPLGLLQSPVFQSVYPMSVLFGTLGSILSHQISHSVDDFSFVENDNRSNCYTAHYHQPGAFNIEHLRSDFVKSEVEADHLGIKLAYSAYKKWQKVNDINETRLLVGNLTTDQTFFLSYVQTWCRTLQPDNWMKLDPRYDFHQPSKQRINSALKDVPEFSKEFNCPLESPMNPSEKCLVW